MRGRGVCMRVKARPRPKEWCPSAPQFWGYPCTYDNSIWHRTTRFRVVTCGAGNVLLARVGNAPSQKGWAQRSPILEVPLLVATSFDVELPFGVRTWGGACLGVRRAIILHKCVSRFAQIGPSWVSVQFLSGVSTIITIKVRLLN